MRPSFRIGRIFGIEIGIHYTWLLAFILIAGSLALNFFPGAAPYHAEGPYWIAGVAAAVCLFVSVLVHELAHSLVARARGIPVRNITLFIFGGVSSLEEEARRPAAEFAMAIVGPVTSLVLAAVLWMAFVLMQPGVGLSGFFHFGGWLPQESLWAAAVYYLALINGLLAAFNLVPGFPLDGGRVLRSVLWAASGNLVRSTTIAARVGWLLGWGFIVFGIFQVAVPPHDFLGGVWIALVGWFLSSAADASRRDIAQRQYLAGARVRDAMDPGQASVSAETSVAEVVEGILSQQYRTAVPVCRDGRPLGVVTIADVRRLPRDRWVMTPVAEIIGRQPMVTVGPDDDLAAAAGSLARQDVTHAVVVADGQCVGLLSRDGIVRYLQLARELRVLRNGSTGS